jgi:hypothetical protein
VVSICHQNQVIVLCLGVNPKGKSPYYGIARNSTHEDIEPIGQAAISLGGNGVTIKK